MQIKVDNPILWPERAHSTDAGVDLRCNEDWELAPGESHLFDTGVSVAIPNGFVGLVFNRSSQGKVNVQITNGVGVIDSSYRGNIKVMLRNTDTINYYIVEAYKTRIAQLVLMPIILPEFVPYTGDDWFNTDRGIGGFGSTGV